MSANPTTLRFRLIVILDSTDAWLVVEMQGGIRVTEVQKAQCWRVKAARSIRRSSELAGSRSTDATREDQDAYARIL